MYVLTVFLEGVEITRIVRDQRHELERIRDNWIRDSKQAKETVPTFAISEYGE